MIQANERENAAIVYKYVKSRTPMKGFFWEDYFKDPVSGFDSFLENLKQYEPWLDLTKEPTDDDLETVMDHINDGQISSAIIMHQVDRVTDKYIGDCSF